MASARKFLRRALAIVAAIAFAGIAAAPTFAADSPAPLAITDWHADGDRSETRIAVEFDRKPSVHWFYLAGPHRLVIDLPDTRAATGQGEFEARGLVSAVRFGAMGANRTRMIVTSERPFVATDMDVAAAADNRFVLSFLLKSASETAFADAQDERASITGSARAEKSDRLGARSARPDGRQAIVIDPGHGGIDSGAISVSGTPEKTITLEFAEALAKRLEADGRYAVHLTRTGDEFLALDERVRIGRQEEAALFISLHADSIAIRGLRGATVYTISEEASDELAQSLADSENRADAAGGIIAEEAPADVADILVDLVRRETQSFSMVFARTLAGTLSERIELIRNPVRSAGFRVLKAPDIPSVLLELGYLSNAEDEAQLKDPVWRAKAVEGIAEAISQFLAKPRDGARG